MKVYGYFLFMWVMFLAAACKYDDDEIRQSVEDLDSRVQKLEELCSQNNTNISALQTLIAALQQNDAITEVSPIQQGDAVIGYTIAFAEASPITIYNGTNGENKYVPVIGTKQDADKLHYWTLNGKWLLDLKSNKIEVVNGIAPQLKIENTHWLISVDNGATWLDCSGTLKGNSDGYFKYIDNSAEEYVTITFIDDTSIKIPKLAPLQIRFDAQDLITIPAKGMRDVRYTLMNADERTTVDVVTSTDLKAKVIAESKEEGIIHIEALGTVDEDSYVTVFVFDSVSRITMAKLTFEESIIKQSMAYNYHLEPKENLIFIDFLSNVEYDIIISESATDWIAVTPESRAIENHKIWFTVQPNTGNVRTGKITIRDKHSNMQISYLVTQRAAQDIELQVERAALMDLYNATNGPSWTNNTNWGSDKPLDEWYGIYAPPGFGVLDIRLGNNNLQGKIPASIGNLSSLGILDLNGNKLEGEVPEEIGKLTHLAVLWLMNNYGINKIPSSLAGCVELKDLYIMNTAISDLHGFIDAVSQLKNLEYLDMSSIYKFRGSLPASITRIMDLPHLEYLNFGYCGFSGAIPTEVLTHPRFNDFAFYCLGQQWNDRGCLVGGFDHIDDVVYYVSDFSVRDIHGNIINNQSLKENKLTLLSIQEAGYEVAFKAMKELYDDYKEQGLEIISFFQVSDNPEAEKWIRDMMKKYGIEWHCVIATSDNVINNLTNNELYGGGNIDLFNPQSFIVDFDGKVCFNAELQYSKIRYIFNTTDFDKKVHYNADLQGIDVRRFVESVLGLPNTSSTSDYVSSDYSRDGEVVTMQTASQGEAIDIIFLGDGFTDRDIADGTYDDVMEQAMENFFSTEPIASYRSRFNIYNVKVVSKHGRFSGNSETALSCRFGNGTEISGDNDKCIEYARRIPGFDPTRSVIVTVLNDIRYAGTCYMYDNDLAIAYCPIVDGHTAERFIQIINHEAVGHGFAKLGDEYAYAYNTSMPADMIASYRQQQSSGWFANVDFTSDPTTVSWHDFLSDTRYTTEQLGVYEGALTYSSGVYRSSIGGIMNTNDGIFNAPSREAIYKRIMQLSEGDGWQYDRNKFVEQDVSNIPTLAARAQMQQKPSKDFVPLHPPVFKKYNQ